MRGFHLAWSPALGIALVLVCLSALQATAPKGWIVAGNKPQAYESGLDTSVMLNEHPSAYLKSTGSNTEGFGTLMQEFRADHYLGKRVRFSAFVRAANAQQWAGLWMRIDKGPTSVAFDNMQDRPLKRTVFWHKYDVVLDVPNDATGIFFGVLLSGTGEVWLNEVKFEVVGADIATTGSSPQAGMTSDEPTNLDFNQ